MFGTEKLEWWGYLTVKNFEDMFSGVHRISVCDEQTDRQTSCDSVVHAMHTHRAVKSWRTISTAHPVNPSAAPTFGRSPDKKWHQTQQTSPHVHCRPPTVKTALSVQ